MARENKFMHFMEKCTKVCNKPDSFFRGIEDNSIGNPILFKYLNGCHTLSIHEIWKIGVTFSIDFTINC